MGFSVVVWGQWGSRRPTGWILTQWLSWLHGLRKKPRTFGKTNSSLFVFKIRSGKWLVCGKNSQPLWSEKLIVIKLRGGANHSPSAGEVPSARPGSGVPSAGAHLFLQLPRWPRPLLRPGPHTVQLDDLRGPQLCCFLTTPGGGPLPQAAGHRACKPRRSVCAEGSPIPRGEHLCPCNVSLNVFGGNEEKPYPADTKISPQNPRISLERHVALGNLEGAWVRHPKSAKLSCI